MPGSCEEPFAPHHYREVLINKDNTQDNTLPRTDEFQNWYSRQRREYKKKEKRRAIRLSTETSRRDLSKENHNFQCVRPMFREKTSSGIRSQGCVILVIRLRTVPGILQTIFLWKLWAEVFIYSPRGVS